MVGARVLAIPYPAQGHVIPLMELAQLLANNGIKITFVNTDFNHKRIIEALSEAAGNINELINLASIPDGMESWEDRNNIGKLSAAMREAMPEKLENLIERINGKESDGDDKIVCVIADYGLGWALEVAEKLGIKKATFFPTAVGHLALWNNAMNLVNEGILNGDGIPLKQQMIRLSPEMPEISTEDFTWTRIGDSNAQRIMFHSILKNKEASKLAEWILCNSSQELEPSALTLVPQCVPIGPLLASNRSGKQAGHFWPEDSTTLLWLDQQQRNSTIYVAFGSFTIFNQTQFQELAIGLELTNRPFLWVVRQDMTHDRDGAGYPAGFLERTKNRGRIVGWAPQQKVLSHPSVACFLSHCGWNSIVEGVSCGVPFLCWPYFADQFLNRRYICGYWEVGLGLEEDESGIVRGDEIRNKVEIIMNDEGYKIRALDLQSKVVSSAGEGGHSWKNLNKFVDWIKEK